MILLAASVMTSCSCTVTPAVITGARSVGRSQRAGETDARQDAGEDQLGDAGRRHGDTAVITLAASRIIDGASSMS